MYASSAGGGAMPMAPAREIKKAKAANRNREPLLKQPEKKTAKPEKNKKAARSSR